MSAMKCFGQQTGRCLSPIPQIDDKRRQAFERAIARLNKLKLNREDKSATSAQTRIQCIRVTRGGLDIHEATSP